MRYPGLATESDLALRQATYERLLLDLVDPQCRRAARSLLFELDCLVGERVALLHDAIWLEVGRSLVAAGYGDLWRALYRLTDYGRFDEHRPGDELRFLALEDVPLPAPPAGFCLPPPGGVRIDTASRTARGRRPPKRVGRRSARRQ
jgi:hypothetical protein